MHYKKKLFDCNEYSYHHGQVEESTWNYKPSQMKCVVEYLIVFVLKTQYIYAQSSHIPRTQKNSIL